MVSFSSSLKLSDFPSTEEEVSANFGTSVAIDGNITVVGVYNKDDIYLNSGKVYVYESTTNGVVKTVLQLSDIGEAEANAWFGYSVAINGDTIVVGAYRKTDVSGTTTLSSAGKAYVYTKSSGIWGYTKTLQLSDISEAQSSALFGFSVAINGDTIVVGANQKTDISGNNILSSSGKAYIYTKSSGTWNHTKTLQLSDIPGEVQSGAEFGCSVAINGDTIVVGARTKSDKLGIFTNLYSGKAYMYTKSSGTWNHTKTLQLSDINEAQTSALFGFSVAINDDTIVVGAYGKRDTSFSYSGKVYIYTKSNNMWSHTKTLQLSDIPGEAQLNAYFGYSVAITKNVTNGYTIVVGANQKTDISGTTGLANSGKAYIYTNTSGTWSHTKTLKLSDINEAQANANFGYSVAINGDAIVVGANQKTNIYEISGKAYMYTKSSITWDYTKSLQLSDFPSTEEEVSANFGSSIAADGNITVVGAYNKDDIYQNSGKVYIYESTDNGVVKTILQLSDINEAQVNALFGFSVAINGDTIVVGARGKSDTTATSGKVYIYTKSSGTWSHTKSLQLSDINEAQTSALFGFSVAINGDTIVVGARGKTDTYTNSGKVYIYTKSSGIWNHTKTLQLSDIPGEAELNAYFGYSVAINGDIIVVGAYGKSDVSGTTTLLSSGKAYIYTKTNEAWSYTKTLQLSDISEAQVNALFGFSVAINGDTIVVGARGKTDISGTTGLANSGKAYIYTKSSGTWSHTKSLQLSDNNEAQPNAQFGYFVAINGDIIIVGARGKTDTYTNSGKAYIYTKSSGTWSHIKTLQLSDISGEAEPNAWFGYSVVITKNATNGYTIVVGAMQKTNLYSQSGKAYTYTLATPPSVPTLIAISGDKNITITFTEPFNGGSTITKYQYTSDGVSWVDTTNTQINISGLTNGTTYTIQVRAVNIVGTGPSSSIQVTPVTIPSAPTNMKIIPGTQSISITFTTPDNGGSPITKYYYSINNSTTWTEATRYPIKITNLVNYMKYKIQLKAVNAIGTGPSSEITSMPLITYLLSRKHKYGLKHKSNGFTCFKDEPYEFIEYIHNTYGYSQSLFDISIYDILNLTIDSREKINYLIKNNYEVSDYVKGIQFNVPQLLMVSDMTGKTQLSTLLTDMSNNALQYTSEYSSEPIPYYNKIQFIQDMGNIIQILKKNIITILKKNNIDDIMKGYLGNMSVNLQTAYGILLDNELNTLRQVI